MIFIVVYWKVGNIQWKWNTTVNISSYSSFNFLYKPAKMNLTKGENLELGSTTE